jgi:hypothetical protein
MPDPMIVISLFVSLTLTVVPGIVFPPESFTLPERITVSAKKTIFGTIDTKDNVKKK